jgi:3-hydroxybutyryl-CoA dehydrogenase
VDLKTVGVIGAGVMGAGIAQNLATTGLGVVMVDVSRSVLQEGMGRLMRGVRSDILAGRLSADKADEAIERVRTSEDLASLEEADFIIENATEKWSIKEGIYKQIDTICKRSTIIAANTSVIPITRLASVTSRAAHIVGTHFMNPVSMKTTVELIRGVHTSDETIEFTKQLLLRMGKNWIVVNDSPGFISNRVLMLSINEAACLVHEHVAEPEQVDAVFRDCLGHKMGPLETADLIGLDTILLSLDGLYDSFSDCKYRPCPLLKTMVYAGRLGRKSGRGFYSYEHI